ncbi:MAG: flippase [Candidatus Kerfeldbacteria bacterium]|nr:flippase [Candidatus Kerfeldbacteria bacterium]
MASNELAAPHSGKNDKIDQPPANGQTILHPDRIAKNTSYLTLALIAQKVLSLGYFIAISRAVGPENIGSYLSALAITTVLGFFIDLNFSQALIRETAKRPEKTNDYLNAALAIKLMLAIGAYAVAQVYVRVFHLPDFVQSLVVLTGLVMVLDSITLSLYSVFRGHQLLKFEAVGTIINKLIVISVGLVGVLALGLGVHLLVVAILIGSIFNVFYASVFVVRRFSWRPRFAGIAADLRYLGRVVLPWFALAGVFVTIYGYIDQVLLSNPLLAGDRGTSYVSWYGTAFKLTFSFQFLPAAVIAAVFPAMSAYFISDRQKLTKTFERAMKYLCILAVPLALGIFTLADKIIIAAYTRAYQASIVPLQILIVSLLFVFLNYPVGYLLNAADRQRRNSIHIGIAMVLNIGLNLLLIPQFTFIGAAVASTASSAVLFLLGIVVARQIVPFRVWSLLMTLFKTIIAAGTMAVALWLLKDRFSVLPLIGSAVIWYFGILFLLRGFSMSDGMSIYRAVMRKVSHTEHDGPRPVSHS